MNLTLSRAQVDQVIEEAKAEIVSRLIGEAGEVRLLSPTQTAALLDVTTNSLSKLHIPQIRLTPTSSIRYRLADVRSYIEKNRK